MGILRMDYVEIKQKGYSSNLLNNSYCVETTELKPKPMIIEETIHWNFLINFVVLALFQSLMKNDWPATKVALSLFKAYHAWY